MTDHACPVCGDSFATDSILDEHCWDAHGACHHCGTEFEERDSLYAHWLVAHEDSLSSKDRVQAVSATGEPTFRDRLAHQGPIDAVLETGLSRRTALLGGLAGIGGIVGVTFLGGSDSNTPLKEHAAAAGIGNQPTLGPAPSGAEGTIIAFEDPSCPSCARFERGAFPRLKSELIDPGRLSFVYRGIPVVFPWSEPAVLALEATYDRSADAFWSLKHFYYREQGSIGSENVRAVTRQFLADRTSVDADAVIDDVDAETFTEAVDADLGASRDADVRGTPTFFLFKEGSFATEMVGPQSYDVFSNSLGM